MSEIKRIDIKEFREKGYLQEANRRFFHPLGLALEIIIEEDTEKLGGVWDYREDPEGIYFDIANRTPEQIKEMQEKKNFIFTEFEKRESKRIVLLGNTTEPVKENEEE